MMTAEPPHSPIVRVSGLSKSFLEGGKRQQVLDGVNLAIQAGECVALLGRSGSGKSTLLSLLAGIDRPDAGELHIDQQPLHRLPERERTLFRRRHIGFVYQFFNLIPTLTVAENVRLPMELNGWPEARVAERTAQLLQEVGLAQRGDSFPDRLSGGEQQRVAIARALAQEPRLVLADEPTGNLDAGTGRQMLGLLFDLTRRAGNTLMVVTHSREVASHADRLLVLEDGVLQEDGQRLTW
jgi:putative ABC transport system ATP-binding protein